MSVELAIIVPTYNERDNVRPLLDKLDAALAGVAWEVIFVDDDSPDGTADIVRAAAAGDARVRCVQRLGRKGLSSACIEGLCASAAPFLAVMDADLQHDETRLPLMLARLRAGGCDLVVGSRYTAGGGVGQWNFWRRKFSVWATKPAQWLGAGTVSDPMSGFFMLRREAFWPAARRLTGIGFKILLDILASSPRPLTVAEVPYTFRPRHAGASKLDLLVVTEYGLLLEDKLIGRWVPLRFAAFVSVGGLGVALHLAALAAGCFALGASFAIAQAAASALAMVLNYFFNNLFTYSDRRRRGAALWTGLAKFVFICALGLTLNVLVAAHLHELGATWWLAGLLGAAVGALWNFGVSAQFVWRTRNAPFASNNGEPKNI